MTFYVSLSRASKNKLMDPSMGRLDYKNFNSIQKLDNSELEGKFAKLLGRIGVIVRDSGRLFKLLSFIVLFATDGTGLVDATRERAEEVQVGRNFHTFQKGFGRSMGGKL